MGWLELIGTPSDGILHRSDCTWLCCSLCQFRKDNRIRNRLLWLQPSLELNLILKSTIVVIKEVTLMSHEKQIKFFKLFFIAL